MYAGFGARAASGNLAIIRTSNLRRHLHNGIYHCLFVVILPLKRVFQRNGKTILES